MSKFTAGDWKAYNSDNGRIFKNWRVCTSDNTLICTLADIPDESRHNALLIASSPLLVDILKLALEDKDDWRALACEIIDQLEE